MLLHFALRLYFAPYIKPRLFVPPQLKISPKKLFFVFDEYRKIPKISLSMYKPPKLVTQKTVR